MRWNWPWNWRVLIGPVWSRGWRRTNQWLATPSETEDERRQRRSTLARIKPESNFGTKYANLSINKFFPIYANEWWGAGKRAELKMFKRIRKGRSWWRQMARLRKVASRRDRRRRRSDAGDAVIGDWVAAVAAVWTYLATLKRHLARSGGTERRRWQRRQRRRCWCSKWRRSLRRRPEGFAGCRGSPPVPPASNRGRRGGDRPKQIINQSINQSINRSINQSLQFQRSERIDCFQSNQTFTHNNWITLQINNKYM